jgi:hypothetical protein
LGALALAGCGGSKSTSTASTSTASVTVPPITTPAPTTAAQTTVTLTKTAPATATKTTATGSINVRVPARFTILPNGSVTPPTVTIPAGLPVELIVVGDAHAHQITLRTTTFNVAPHQQAEKLVDGLKPGSYPLKVDGARKAMLTIGGNPGP